ncbi:MAG: hypothetical protein ACREL4_03735 [Gemmatimonadales bacterium]
MPEPPDRIPAWLIVSAAVVMALPFGWGLGLMLALLIAGRDFGQLPAATVPIALIASIGFALWPRVRPRTRLKVLTAGTVLCLLLARLAA